MGAPDKSRILAGIASAALDALILLALITGLRDQPARHGSSPLVSVALTALPAPHQTRPKPRPAVKHFHHQAAALAGARAVPTLAYVPRIPLARSALAAATNPDSGPGFNSGTADAGTGGGAGNGASGGGSGDNGGTDAEWISGQIGNSDYPPQAADRGAQGTVRTEITVAPNGRISGCQVIRSSGDPDLDATTCRLILRRFRFRPATDDAGRTIADTVEYDQEWVLSRAAVLPVSH